MFRDFPAMFDDHKGMVKPRSSHRGASLDFEPGGLDTGGEDFEGKSTENPSIHPFGLDSTISTLFKMTIVIKIQVMIK
jgi:hypothetical protein